MIGPAVSLLMAPPRPQGIVSRAAAGRAKKIRRQGQALDHENRKIPISKPTANAQRPNVQAETTRTRLRRSSCGISWDRSVIAAAPAVAASAVTGEFAILAIVPRCLKKRPQHWGLAAIAGAVLMDGRQRSRHGFKFKSRTLGAVCPASDTLAGDRRGSPELKPGNACNSPDIDL